MHTWQRGRFEPGQTEMSPEVITFSRLFDVFDIPSKVNAILHIKASLQ